jgi:hypothetical protein
MPHWRCRDLGMSKKPRPPLTIDASDVSHAHALSRISSSPGVPIDKKESGSHVINTW